MANLQKQGAVAEPIATFNAFRAPNTKRFLNPVFVIRVLDERPFNGCSGTELVLGTCVQVVGFGLKITSAKLAVTADRVSVHASDRGLLKHTTCGAKPTSHAFLWIYLPDGDSSNTASRDHPCQSSQPG
jgi:hypothetical protein